METQRALEAALLAHADAVVVEVRAAPARRREDLAPHQVVHHGMLELAAVLAGDGDREHREAVQEVGGAVERVDDPDRLAVAALDFAAFLGEERMLRIVLADVADDLGFRRLVDPR